RPVSPETDPRILASLQRTLILLSRDLSDKGLLSCTCEPLSLDVDTRGAEEEESERRRAMPDLSFYQTRGAELNAEYLSGSESASRPASTGGVVHLELICSDLDANIRFCAHVLALRLTGV